MRTFPVMLKLQGRPAVVIGGGEVGLRKAGALQSAGAVVRLVCDKAPNESMDGLEVRLEPYRPEHLAGAAIVFACTDDSSVNARIVRDARAAGALACAVDQPDDSDFLSPAVAQDGEVILAVGTGGAAPHLAGWLARRLAEALPERIGRFAACLAELRRDLLSAPNDPRRRHRLLKTLADEETYRTFLASGEAGVRRRLQTLLNEPGGD